MNMLLVKKNKNKKNNYNKKKEMWLEIQLYSTATGEIWCTVCHKPRLTRSLEGAVKEELPHWLPVTHYASKYFQMSEFLFRSTEMEERTAAFRSALHTIIHTFGLRCHGSDAECKQTNHTTRLIAAFQGKRTCLRTCVNNKVKK